MTEDTVSVQNVEIARSTFTPDEWTELAVALADYAHHLTRSGRRERTLAPEDFAAEAVYRFLTGKRRLKVSLAGLPKKEATNNVKLFLLGTVKSLVSNSKSCTEAKLRSLEEDLEQAEAVSFDTYDAAGDMDAILRCIDSEKLLGKHFKRDTLQYKVLRAILDTGGSSHDVHQVLQRDMPGLELKAVYNARASILRKLQVIANQEPAALAKYREMFVVYEGSEVSGLTPREVVGLAAEYTPAGVLARVGSPFGVGGAVASAALRWWMKGKTSRSPEPPGNSYDDVQGTHKERVRRLESAGVDVTRLQGRISRLLHKV